MGQHARQIGGNAGGGDGPVRGVRVRARALAQGAALLLMLACVLCVPLSSQKRPQKNHNTGTNTSGGHKTGSGHHHTPTPPPVAKPFTPNFRQYDFDVLTIDAQGVVHKVDGPKAQASYYAEDLGDGVTMEMVKVGQGTFLMGTPDADLEQVKKEYTRYCPDDACSAAAAAALRSETPQHRVTVPAFYMSRTEVTQAQWEAVANKLPQVRIRLNPRPSVIKSDPTSDPFRPVESITWREAVEFCERLSRKTGLQYRLPTEAEWEYACRGGTDTQFAFGETVAPSLVNYNSERPYDDAPKAVARRTTRPYKFSPEAMNRFGLYDLVGNVSEWCLDAWHDSYKGAPADGAEWAERTADSRVVRGCSWADAGYVCRSAYRLKRPELFKNPTIGFRVVMTGKWLTGRRQPRARQR